MSPQPRNTKIMRREGPWGRAGWFRSRYLTLTDATAGRLERSRRHSAADGPHPPPPPGRVDGGSGRPRPQAATPAGGSSKCSPVRQWGGACRQESGGRAAAGPGRQPWGLPRAPRPSGVATCARNTQSVRLCWGSWEAEGVWLREAKWECGRGRDKDHTCVCVSVGVTDHSPAPFQTQLSRRAQVTPEPGVGACKESHRAPAPPSSVTCRWRRGVHGQPRPPLPPTVAGGGSWAQ